MRFQGFRGAWGSPGEAGEPGGGTTEAEPEEALEGLDDAVLDTLSRRICLRPHWVKAPALSWAVERVLSSGAPDRAELLTQVLVSLESREFKDLATRSEERCLSTSFSPPAS